MKYILQVLKVNQQEDISILFFSFTFLGFWLITVLKD
ncbi:MAG: hypothetical protein BWY41_01502 [Candidatus Atribacteria bacterium ADurb.Bin276]|uniref:Uncharacterized protein n=1 Tax=Candidatus Atribacter allofermentans TaxID=1852833 RepID=A0A1V5SPG1_9BACT|nr:MAG: hypothetical protein BWY41_01502 [Candidatus Atribacteria bacterium ADurb.Bin276]